VVITNHHITAQYPRVTSDDQPIASTSGEPSTDHSEIPRYEFRVKGHLESRWTVWFDGLSLTGLEDGTTVISGAVVDQAALHGLLHKLRDIGIPLVSLSLLPPHAPAASTIAPPAPRTPEGN
jgi:hypothetical protein